MAFFIAIETATKVCSVALFQDEKLLSSKKQEGDYSHAENLAVFVDALMNEQELKYNQLNAIAVSKGPGSYTGLRIGVSFAKGLCYSLQIPLISINTLKAMAWGTKQQIGNLDVFLCPMIDARRMEVFSAIFDAGLNVVKNISADIIEEESYKEYLDQKEVYFFGDGAEKSFQVIKHSNSKLINRSVISAENMAEIIVNKYQSRNFEDVAYFEPYYLKQFIALKGKKLV